jgi:hypothetical protein
MPKLYKADRINLKNHPDINEVWIHKCIAEDPSILGLGDLVLKDKERPQPKSGRLDLLLQDPDTNRRYEVEIQLGKTDESHIIRTLEYWDIERKRYPQYDHCAVIVAEDITSRFNNVISLFNGTIPLIAIQLSAYKFQDQVALTFTTVIDELTLGLVDDDEEVREVTDRNYWTKRGTEKTVQMADQMVGLINEFAPGFDLKYNKFYIGLTQDGQPKNFAVFRPRKSGLNAEFRIPFSEELQKKIEDAGIDDMGYLKRWGAFRLRLVKGDIDNNKELLRELLKTAYENFK